MKSIEVEIRGNLDEAEYARVKEFLNKNGVYKGSQEREMILLRDYPGYSKDFVNRSVDIRLRNTDGFCEVMLKQQVGGAREEVSLPLTEHTLDTAKKIVKALGCKEGVWMHRIKEVYDYNGVEWSLVIAPPANIRYYEAEIATETKGEIADAHEKLVAAAQELGVEVLDDEGTRALIHRLDTEANKVVEL